MAITLKAKRARKLNRNREWLRSEYEEKGRSAKAIGSDTGVTETVILYWLRKHDIKRRRPPPPHKIINGIVDGRKRCSVCKNQLPIKEFSKNRATWDGYMHICRKCGSERRRARRDQYRQIRFRRLYGLDNYLELYDQQEGKCAICGRHEERYRGLHVDHNHSTGSVRGLLCNWCNIMVGASKDRPDVLRAGADYLIKPR